MSDDKIRNHFRQEQEEAIKAEKDIELAVNIEKMKPLVKLLNALNEELCEIEGLAIHPYTNGEAVMIVSKTDHDHIHCYIKPGNNSIYSYCESGLSPDYEFITFSDSVDEIMA